jgi:hypothetical protein
MKKPAIESFKELDIRFRVIEFDETETGNPQTLETYGPELELVRSFPPNQIWTVVDGDDGELYVCAGYHLVNRINYLITKNPWVTGDETYRY